MVAHELLDIRRRNGMKISERLQRPISSAIFLVGKALKETRVGLDPLCLEKRVLVLELQAFHKMTEDGESGICEVWCSKGNADGIKEWWDSMLRTVTVLDLGLKFCQMLELGVNRCSAFQGNECIAS